MKGEFSGKTIVITGGGAGFGRAFAKTFADQDATVALLDIDDTSTAEFAAQLEKRGSKVIAIHCDVADSTSVKAAFAQIGNTWGGINVLVNNAGLHSAEYNLGFAAMGEQAVRRLFDVNVMGVVNCSVAARDLLAKRRGSITNIASIAAYANTTAYGVSKLAVRGITMAFAHEFAPDGIRVNAIAPGLIATEKIRSDFPDEFFDSFSKDLQLVHRTGEVDDVVNALLFLCGPKASFVTGETLRVSGGYPLSL